MIHFLLTSQFKLKLYKSECGYSYAIARSVGFRGSISDTFGWAKISEPYDD